LFGSLAAGAAVFIAICISFASFGGMLTKDSSPDYAYQTPADRIESALPEAGMFSVYDDGLGISDEMILASGMAESSDITAGQIYSDAAWPTAQAENTSFAPSYVSVSADISIEVDDFDAALIEISNISGQVESRWINENQYGSSNASISQRVRQDELDGVVKQIEDIGRVLYQSQRKDEITYLVYDNNASLIAKENEYVRLLDLLKKTETVSDMLTVETRLSVVNSDIDWRRSDRSRLLNSSDYPLINVTLTGISAKIIDEPPRFSERLKSSFVGSINGTLSFAEAFIVLIVAALPFIAPLGVLGASVLAIRRITRKKSVNPRR